MNRSTQAEHAKRINAAIGILQEADGLAEAAQMLAQRYTISIRHAYRYIRIAQRHGGKIVIPVPKKVFTLKLPIDLIEQIRRKAQQTGRSISDIVTEALRCFLAKR